MTECSQCGDCCDPVIATFDPQVHAAEQIADHGDRMEEWARHQYEFFLQHWRSEGTSTNRAGHVVHLVRCDQFDRETRTCLAHATRPQVCSGFPWYGHGEGDPARNRWADELSPRCSFTADVRMMLPIVEIRDGRQDLPKP